MIINLRMKPETTIAREGHSMVTSDPTWRRCALDLCDNGVASRSLVTWLLAANERNVILK